MTVTVHFTVLPVTTLRPRTWCHAIVSEWWDIQRLLCQSAASRTKTCCFKRPWCGCCSNTQKQLRALLTSSAISGTALLLILCLFHPVTRAHAKPAPAIFSGRSSSHWRWKWVRTEILSGKGTTQTLEDSPVSHLLSHWMLQTDSGGRGLVQVCAITQVRLMKVKLSSVKPVNLLRVNVRQTCCCWSSVFCRSTQVRQVAPSPPPHTHTHCWFVFVQPDQSPASRTVFGFRVYNYYTWGCPRVSWRHSDSKTVLNGFYVCCALQLLMFCLQLEVRHRSRITPL